MSGAHLAFVLHAHLPFVRHPEYDSFLEERWLFEAMTETYIPLLKVFQNIAKEKVPCQLNFSISPCLLAMLNDELLQERYRKHLKSLIELCEREKERHKHDGHFQYLADVYHKMFSECLMMMEQTGGNLSLAFKECHEQGVIELMTASATHGFLPLLSSSPEAVNSQLRTGLNYFEEVFGFCSKGLWLPECAFAPGLDEMLEKEGVRYFILESHGIDHASHSPVHSVHAPLYTPGGVAAFARDQASLKEVWSAREGFPGDGAYREFYRDIGHEADYDYIEPYIVSGVRVDTGIKYHRITGDTDHKEPYHPELARERAAQHAGDFVHHRQGQLQYLKGNMSVAPVVVAPFDAELFGHWWFEGPQWLDFVIRKAAFDQDTFSLTSLSAYLDKNPMQQSAMPCTSTWGHKGYFETWINEKTDWIYPQLHQCALRMKSLINSKQRQSKSRTRALNQCLRELLLAQSSDWPFIITGGTAETYAVRRVKDHVSRFHYLADQIASDSIDAKELSLIEEIDRIFPNIDYRSFAP